MAEECGGDWSIPVDRYPGPVCRYSVTDGTPTLSAVDVTFESEFERVESGADLSETFRSIGIAVDAIDEFEHALADGEQFSVPVTGTSDPSGSRMYRVRPIPPEDGADGHLLFAEGSDGGDAFGVDHVASVISHDLRNPLDVAKTRLRAGRDLGDDDHFEHVERAHERMERIIEDVLTLARGEDVVDPDETVDLEAVATRAWETVETHGASFVVDGQLPTTTADPDRVGRLFENLFRNAVEHGSPGSDAADLTVTVGRLRADSGDGFYVADDGTGIPDTEHDRVFEPGYTSDDHGTGLGLAIVERIATLHGWSSAVTSASAGGTRVEIRDVTPVGQS
jgi:two-component sensor histidine kinase